MSVFLIFVGVCGWLLGLAMFAAAKGGIHEVAGLVAIGSGTLAIGLAGILNKLEQIRKTLTSAQANPIDPPLIG